MAIQLIVIDDQFKFHTFKINFAGKLDRLEHRTFLISQFVFVGLGYITSLHSEACVKGTIHHFNSCNDGALCYIWWRTTC